MVSVAVIGSGAVGCYYGGLLARARHDVRFLMRSDYEAVTTGGLTINSPKGDFRLEHVRCYRDPAEIGVCDWILCALKATALDEARRLCSPCAGPNTRLLAIINGLTIEETFSKWMAPAHVFGGMAFVGINRVEPGVIHHLAYGQVTIGNAADDASGNAELAELLRGAGIDTIVAPNLRAGRWEKLAWNVPFNGLSVAAGGAGVQTLLDAPRLRTTAEKVMREVLATGNRDLEQRGSPARLDIDATVVALFGMTESLGDYRTSMAIDLREGRPLEVEAIHGAVVRRAHALGVPTPELDRLYEAVREADPAGRQPPAERQWIAGKEWPC